MLLKFVYMKNLVLLLFLLFLELSLKSNLPSFGSPSMPIVFALFYSFRVDFYYLFRIVLIGQVMASHDPPSRELCL